MINEVYKREVEWGTGRERKENLFSSLSDYKNVFHTNERSLVDLVNVKTHSSQET